MPNSEFDRSWHLDKRVPLVMIFTILIQTGTFIWFAAGLFNRVEVLERQAVEYRPNIERIIKLETRMESIQDGISEIKSLIRGRIP